MASVPSPRSRLNNLARFLASRLPSSPNYDRTVRDALQIKADDGAFSVLHFDPAEAGILEQIRRELTPQVPDAPVAELYNLNVYAAGGHFVPHKDTPRGDDMLVCCRRATIGRLLRASWFLSREQLYAA